MCIFKRGFYRPTRTTAGYTVPICPRMHFILRDRLVITVQNILRLVYYALQLHVFTVSHDFVWGGGQNAKVLDSLMLLFMSNKQEAATNTTMILC